MRFSATGLPGSLKLDAATGIVSGAAPAKPGEYRVTLSAASEVPASASSATGTGEITVSADGSVRGSIKVAGMSATAAHMHQGATGVAGPVIVPMTKEGDDAFAFAPNARLTPEQYAAWRSGNTYINVHSAAHPTGEIRSDQLKGY